MEKKGVLVGGGGDLSEREMVRDSNEAVLQVPEGKKWELGETW